MALPFSRQFDALNEALCSATPGSDAAELQPDNFLENRGLSQDDIALPRRPRAAGLVLAGLTLGALGGCDQDPPCPKELASARKLIVVEAETMDTPVARLSIYQRATPSDTWVATGATEPAVVGSKGLAWGWSFQELAESGEPLKVEGDRRTPAGMFALGPTFGFEPSSTKGHLLLAKDQSVCVDDPNSPHYSRVVTREEAGQQTAGEEMWAIPLYKHGIAVNYPTNREARAGSCIFVHIWQSEGQGTSGCVAAAEEKVKMLQQLAADGEGVIAVFPKPARERLASCLP